MRRTVFSDEIRKISGRIRFTAAFFAVLFPVWGFSAPGCFAEEDSEAFAVLEVNPAGISDEPQIPKAISPVSLEELDGSILRGVQFLLKGQNRDGSWGTPRNTKKLNIYAPGAAHDGYLSGTTALALEALLRVERMIQEENEASVNSENEALRSAEAAKVPQNSAEMSRALRELLPEISASIDRSEAWMFTNMLKLKRSAQDVLYNNWGHAYGMSTFRMMYERKLAVSLTPEVQEERLKKIRECIQYQIQMLESDECLAGGWCYYDMQNSAEHPSASTLCFLTGTVLVSFADARECGVEIPQRLVERGVDSLLRQRRPNGSFAYGEYTANRPASINHSAASLGRSQVCHLALGLWGDTKIATQQEYTDWLNRLISRIGWLDIGRKRPVPHESWFNVAGYFYYYAHYYAARVVDELEDSESQKNFSNYLAAIQLGLQEKDGSWWDYPLYDYHPYYGTGMALSTLVRCREHLK